MKSDYEKYSLQALRTYGRQIGVNSPTSKKKEDLISEIIKIETGEVKPSFTKKGRRVKNGIVSIKLEKDKEYIKIQKTGEIVSLLNKFVEDLTKILLK